MAADRTIADGQLAASSATLVTGALGLKGHVTLMLQNTGTAQETILVTLTRANGTARRLSRIVLEENESAHLRNVPIQQGDVIAGYTTTASSVDYLIFGAPGGGLALELYDASGASKGVTTLRKILLGIEYLVGDELPDPG